MKEINLFEIEKQYASLKKTGSKVVCSENPKRMGQ